MAQQPRRTTTDLARRRLIFALDVASGRDALRLVDLLRDEVGMFKIGKQLFLHAGPSVVRDVRARGGEVFLDLKLHDIPRTVAAAGVEAARLGVQLFNVHASGGSAMMRETAREITRVCRTEGRRRPNILAVTVLTSLDREDLQQIGIRSGVERQVTRLALLARAARLDGVVASPQEAARVRRECGKSFLIVTPGVRLPKGRRQDQKRVTTPADAIQAGADLLVVGSPIRDAKDPVAAARAVVASIQEGLSPPRS